MDREDIEQYFRSQMQYLRHLAKKYGFTIKQYPENAEIAERDAAARKELKSVPSETFQTEPPKAS